MEDQQGTSAARDRGVRLCYYHQSCLLLAASLICHLREAYGIPLSVSQGDSSTNETSPIGSTMLPVQQHESTDRNATLQGQSNTSSARNESTGRQQTLQATQRVLGMASARVKKWGSRMRAWIVANGWRDDYTEGGMRLHADDKGRAGSIVSVEGYTSDTYIHYVRDASALILFSLAAKSILISSLCSRTSSSHHRHLLHLRRGKQDCKGSTCTVGDGTDNVESQAKEHSFVHATSPTTCREDTLCTGRGRGIHFSSKNTLCSTTCGEGIACTMEGSIRHSDQKTRRVKGRSSKKHVTFREPLLESTKDKNEMRHAAPLEEVREFFQAVRDPPVTTRVDSMFEGLLTQRREYSSHGHGAGFFFTKSTTDKQPNGCASGSAACKNPTKFTTDKQQHGCVSASPACKKLAETHVYLCAADRLMQQVSSSTAVYSIPSLGSPLVPSHNASSIWSNIDAWHTVQPCSINQAHSATSIGDMLRMACVSSDVNQ